MTTEIKDYNDIESSTFEDLNLKDTLLRGIYSCGYEVPSSIQKKAILPVIDKHDVIAQAQSGTGKTATFSIGMLQNIDENLQETQSLILSHTRELSLQIMQVVKNFTTYMNLTYNLSVGGTTTRNIDELLKIQIVIGTLEHIRYD